MSVVKPGVKWSQYVEGGNTVAGDEVVGLRNGINTRFTAPVAGASTFLSKNILQTAHGFTVGQILRFNGTLYVLAEGDTETDADVIGMVIGVVDTNNFVLLFGGYFTGLIGLTSGSVHFLSPIVAGGFTTTSPVTPGQVRKALFVADSTTSGYWLNYAGQVL